MARDTPVRDGGGRRPEELGGYRGLAATVTVAFHVWQHYTSYGPAGKSPPVDSVLLEVLFAFEMVDLFLVLSAYLLTLSYARAAIDREPVKPARAFLFRRAIRILPLYWIVVTVVWAARNPRLPGDWVDLVEHLTFTQVFDVQRIFYTVGPAWSMSLEVMFYGLLVVLGPLAVCGCARLARRGARIAVLAAGCIVLFCGPVLWLATAHFVLQIPETHWPSYFGPHARFSAFAAGMLLAVVVAGLDDSVRLAPAAGRVIRICGLAALTVLAWQASEHRAVEAVVSHPVASLLWVLLLFVTIRARSTGLWHRVLASRPLTAIGLASYSLYLWHEPIMIQLGLAGLLPVDFARGLLVVLAISLPTALLSYWMIEYPASLLGRLRDAAGAPRHFY